jgi:hypothetical protein
VPSLAPILIATFTAGIMQQRDYIIDQIDKAAQFIASLITNTKTEIKEQAALDQTLSALTGLDNSFFINSDPGLLKAVLPLVADDNAKAMAAWILRQKDLKVYGEIHECLMANLELEKLAPKVRALFIKSDTCQKAPMNSKRNK